MTPSELKALLKRITDLEKEVADQRRIIENHRHTNRDRTKALATSSALSFIGDYSVSASGQILFESTGDDIRFTASNGAAVFTLGQAFDVSAGGNILLKAGVGGGAGAADIRATFDTETATGSNAGFLYIPTVNGTPTGTPTSVTGGVALIYNRSANKIQVYNGAWKATAALT